MKVTVKKDSTGKLTAETEAEGMSLFTFTNTYHEDGDNTGDENNKGDNKVSTPVSVNPSVTKKIVGDTPEQKETFGFALTGISVNDDEEAMPTGAKDGTKTVTVEGEGTHCFRRYPTNKSCRQHNWTVKGTCIKESASPLSRTP